MSIKQLTKDEQASRSITVDMRKKTAVIVHTVKPSKVSATRYELKWTLDFSDVTPLEIATAAVKSWLISLQSDWRKDPKRMDEKRWHNVTFSIRDLIDTARARKKKTDAEKMDALAEKMSKSEIADAIKKLEKMM